MVWPETASSGKKKKEKKKVTSKWRDRAVGGGLGGTEGRKPQSIHVCVSDFPSSSPERLTSSELLGAAHHNGAFCPATRSSAFRGYRPSHGPIWGAAGSPRVRPRVCAQRGRPTPAPARHCQSLSSRHSHIKQFSTKTSTTLNSA